MINIIKASAQHAALLSALAGKTFIESHGHSASQADIDSYAAEKYREEVLLRELEDAGNIYHLIYYNERPAGFSKIVFNTAYNEASGNSFAKLERIYLLEEFHDLKLGLELINFNIALAKHNNQAGMWLYVWMENNRAVNFYKRNGFIIIGSHDFRISETHSNPNHQMLLLF